MRLPFPLFVFAAACLAFAPARATAPFEMLDIEGKDVMWLATPDSVVDRMLHLARVTSQDVVVDLGSGDGRIPIAAARRFGARGLGIEFNGKLVAHSRSEAIKQGVEARVRFVQADLFETNFDEATVVTLYLLSSLNVRLRPKLLALWPGTRVVSNAFNMGDWAPDESEAHGEEALFLWRVPARVAGAWTVRRAGGSFALHLRQTYQKLDGHAERSGARLALRSATLAGAAIRLEVEGVDAALRGQVDGDTMRGGEGAQAWTARRNSAR